jgi:hypothetical protein
VLLTHGLRAKKKKGYFFIRLFAMSPPQPNNVPITIMLGSGTAAGAVVRSSPSCDRSLTKLLRSSGNVADLSEVLRWISEKSTTHGSDFGEITDSGLEERQLTN